MFGGAGATHAEPNNLQRVYAALLREVRDPRGNRINYSYSADSGAVYLSSLSYGANDSSGTPHAYTVRFSYSAHPRPTTSFATGFGISRGLLLSGITIFALDEQRQEQRVLAYQLAHGLVGSAFMGLSSVQRFGSTNEDAVPPTFFSYHGEDGPLAPGNRIGLLKEIQTPLGGRVELSYTPSAAIRVNGASANPGLPFMVHTLSDVWKNSHSSATRHRTAYTYEGGHYFFDPRNAHTREYAGFARVTRHEESGEAHVSSFHQSEFAAPKAHAHQDHISKKGRAYKAEIFAKGGEILSETRTHWDHTALAGERRFMVTKGSQTTFLPGSQAAHTEFLYDSLGRLTKEQDLGEVDEQMEDTDPTDNRTTEYTYATNLDKHLLNYPARVRVFGGAGEGELLQEVRTSYDGLPLGSIEKGLPTRVETRLALGEQAEDFSVETLEYGPHGLPTLVTNALGGQTTISYNQQLRPSHITNPHGHRSSFWFHPLFGVPVQTRGPNGQQVQLELDGLGRTVRELRSHPQTGELTTSRTAAYSLASRPASIFSEVHLGHGNISRETRAYVDGFGRPLQQFIEAKADNQYIMTSTTYDALGRVAKETLPRFVRGNAFQPIDSADLGTTYAYDGLGRITQRQTPTGTQTHQYSGRTERRIGPNGHAKEFDTDTRGALVRVREEHAEQTYQTTYTRDALGRLVGTQDAEGNRRAVEYDLGGRVTRRELLHRPGEAVFAWEFWHDAAGNPIRTRDPRGTEINRVFDATNRLLSTHHQDQTLATYQYDSAPNGLGKLGAVDTPHVQKAMAYDQAGGIAMEEKTIGGQTYQTHFTRDLAGNMLELRYPSGARVRYAYDAAGLLGGIFRCGAESAAGECLAEGVVADINYAENGAISRIEYAGGVVEEKTFPREQAFRLASASATGPDGQLLLSMAYDYDPAGNLTALRRTDTLGTREYRYTYDPLHRLLQMQANNQTLRTYDYSPTGNILQKSNIGHYQYTAPHPQAVSQAGERSFTYDAAGNLLSDGTWNHQWDEQGRLTSSTQGEKGEKTVQHHYDEGGARVQSISASGHTTTYVGEHLDIFGTRSREYVHLGTQRIASLDAAPDPCTPPAAGNWVVDGAQCLVSQSATITGDVLLSNGASITVQSGATLHIDLAQHRLQIDASSALRLRSGARIAGLNDADIPPALLPEAFVPMALRGPLTQASSPDAQPLSLDGARPFAIPQKYETIPLVASSTQQAPPPAQTQLPWEDFRASAPNASVIVSEFLAFFPSSQTLEGSIANGKKAGTPQPKQEQEQQETEAAPPPPLPIPLPPRASAPTREYGHRFPAPVHLASVLSSLPDPLPTASPNPQMHFHLLDHLGSSALDISAAGEALATRSFFPFGEAQEEVEHIPHEGNVYGFTGKEEDEDTGLHYFEARFYDAGVGRFMGVDPWVGDESDPQTLNKYSYVVNRPLVAVDPSGETLYYVTRDLAGRHGDYSVPGILGSHSFLVYIPDHPETRQTVPFATFGGQKDDQGNLVGEINNQNDVFAVRNAEVIKEVAIIQTPDGMTEQEHFLSILKAHDSYNENPARYDFLSVGEGYNCHNYAATIIENSESAMPNIDPWSVDPGLGEIIPNQAPQNQSSNVESLMRTDNRNNNSAQNNNKKKKDSSRNK